MKKIISLLAIMVLLFGCTSQNIDHVNISSDIYSDEDIEEAIDVVESYFQENFSGCTLIEVSYAGDAYEDEFEEYALKYQSDEAIILNTTFETDENGGDGSLEPNMTYEDFHWILVRNTHGEWIHEDHGY